MPDLEDVADEDVEKTKEWYKERYGTVFLEDTWSAWHIRVWANSREANGFGVGINAMVVFEYAKEFKANKIETLELIKEIEQGVNSA